MGDLQSFLKNICWTQQALKAKAGSKGTNIKLVFVGREQNLPTAMIDSAPSHLRPKLKSKSTVENWAINGGSQWVLQTQIVEAKSHYGFFAPSAFAIARDLVGTCIRQILTEDIKSLQIDYLGASEEELKGIVVGLEMGRYVFKKIWPASKLPLVPLKIKSSLKNADQVIKEGCALGESVNLARFLVDLPGNALTPKSYAELLKVHFSALKGTKINVWNHQKLAKENMGLHCAVGEGSVDKSYMVHIEYRGLKNAPVYALVGKGITFDTGGLDIKPSSGMRLMKKDMGGSASVAGIANFVVREKLACNCDFYFAIAENAVSAESFRPGDIVTARNGQTVEIHNTDAEGRLVLADVMALAAETKPSLMIDIATLTGAIKFGLGATVPGLFSNDDNLAETLLRSGQAMGDGYWRMPLIPEESARLKSDVADLINCTDGFGGAVTAALFLEKFTGGIPWAHLDIYGWADRAKGPFAYGGGNGQVVQALCNFLQNQVKNQKA